MSDRISTSFTRTQWLAIRQELKDKGLIDKKWIDAIRLLRERVNVRYLDPLEILITHDKSSKSAGFSIATIECALMEFIAALIEGRLFKKPLSPTDNTHRFYSDSALVYSRFLRTSIIFGQYFSSPNNNPSFRPDDFYKNVRCALIHEAQTKNGWEIKIFGRTKDNDLKNKIIFQLDNTTGKKILYRTALFYSLRDYFNHYCNVELIENTPKGRVLRKFLARKIDYMLEIKPDDKFWWK
jgi:hypothetical protein